MKLPFDQLNSHLASQLSSLYTLHSDEALLVEESLDAIRAAVRTSSSNGPVDRAVYVVQGARFDWGPILASGQSMSLFGGQQLVEIRIPTGKPGKEGATALQQIAQSVANSPGVFTLVILPKLDNATKNQAWFTALESNGVTIQIDSVERSVLPQWIARRLAAQGQRVQAGEAGSRTLQFFADRVEGNLMAAHQEVLKLGLLYPKGEITSDQIENAVLNVARYDVFKLSPAVLAGNGVRAQRMLDGLRAEGENEVMVHFVLSEDIRAILRVKDLVANGKSLPIAMRESRVWGPREKLMELVLPNVTADDAVNLIASAHIVDGIVKGIPSPGWSTDSWQALAQLMQSLCLVCAKGSSRQRSY
jgi:DNA polymerase-3 subunit delta